MRETITAQTIKTRAVSPTPSWNWEGSGMVVPANRSSQEGPAGSVWIGWGATGGVAWPAGLARLDRPAGV
jgi:hypothetical protein